MVTRRFLLVGAFLGFASVLLGAFGAHILKNVLTDTDVEIYELGARYQFYHSLAILIVAIAARYLSARWTNIAGWLFVVGIVLFSGSLYGIALSDTFGLNEMKALLGPITPFGGILLLVGWLVLFRAAFDYKRPRGRYHQRSESQQGE